MWEEGSWCKKVGKIWSLLMNFPKNAGIKVKENGNNGRGGKERIARGQVGKCTG
jgi:hypothetical protein